MWPLTSLKDQGDVIEKIAASLPPLGGPSHDAWLSSTAIYLLFTMKRFPKGFFVEFSAHS
jgi:hypothetical protein